MDSRFLGERDGAEEPLRLRACIYLCGLVVPCGCCVHVIRPNTCAASFLFETPAGNFTTASFADEDAAKITEY